MDHIVIIVIEHGYAPTLNSYLKSMLSYSDQRFDQEWLNAFILSTMSKIDKILHSLALVTVVLQSYELIEEDMDRNPFDLNNSRVHFEGECLVKFICKIKQSSFSKINNFQL